jgi:hypothetical protein
MTQMSCIKRYLYVSYVGVLDTGISIEWTAALASKNTRLLLGKKLYGIGL